MCFTAACRLSTTASTTTECKLAATAAVQPFDDRLEHDLALALPQRKPSQALLTIRKNENRGQLDALLDPGLAKEALIVDQARKDAVDARKPDDVFHTCLGKDESVPVAGHMAPPLHSRTTYGSSEILKSLSSSFLSPSCGPALRDQPLKTL